MEEGVEQPLTGFNFSYWFSCVECGRRVEIAADLYERQTSGTQPADFSRCQCGTEVEVTALDPVLGNPNDVALPDDDVDGLYWYHTSPYQKWPDTEAYTAHVRALILRSPALGGLSAQQLLEQHTSRALHIGTYEATIENMLRRRQDEDRHDGPPVRYWLHRVRIQLRPGDLTPGVGEELGDWVGVVPLSMLHERDGARAARYVNTDEANGSISVAIDPAVIATVSSIEIPIASLGTETPDAAAAAAHARTALARIAPLRPDTAGVDRMALRFPETLPSSFPDPAHPERLRIEAMVEQLDSYNGQHEQIWRELKATLEAEYLPDINDQVRRRFRGALPHTDDPIAYHHTFRQMCTLLSRPHEVIGKLALAPIRTINTIDGTN
ncbi:hypothetical protein [Mycobacterium sp. EPa45]|uniref:hypothetical protein n=1 Tax=Mycobacterium sp. EPa45 TaxID=1545728 RepID=UPI0006424027|nr:hypothetical protein [Mycobacterium sp. EPa45]AKK27838.1 hypothetical protein AB431_15395 [Mycobacterium sp. EPa45]